MSVLHKHVLYVGGLDDAVTTELVRAAFIPFGELSDVAMPFDNQAGKHRGFAFVTFAEAGDAADAMDNMHGAELLGKTLTCNLARAQGQQAKAVWNMSNDELEQMHDRAGGQLREAGASAAAAAAPAAATGPAPAAAPSVQGPARA